MLHQVDERVCAAQECERTDILARNYCPAHYYKWRKWGNADEPNHTRWAGYDIPPCSVEGCQKPSRLYEMCPAHANRLIRHGDASIVLRNRRGPSDPQLDQPCSADDCDRPARVKGMCRRHYTKNLRASNRMMATVQNHRRRARKLDAYVYDYTADDINARLAYWGNRCWMCGGDATTVDHVKPMSKGGKDCPANLRPACAPCNSTKNAKWYGVTELHRFLKP